MQTNVVMQFHWLFANSLCSEFEHSRSNSAIHQVQSLHCSLQINQEPVESATYSITEDKYTKFEMTTISILLKLQ